MKEYDVSIDKIESAIERMLLINPTDISSDKIKLLCMNNDSSTKINDNEQDEIYKNSKDILKLYGQLLSINDDSISGEIGGLQ
jgi:predicted oxidoreductase (fatty acid repression mutant protein)